MKLFHQLTSAQQDAAIEHCADLVANNAIENGLRFEALNGEEGAELKNAIDSLMEELKQRTELQTREEKLQFLMEDETFADTIMELALEMAHQAFYHDVDEFVVFTDVLDERVELNESSSEEELYEDEEAVVMKSNDKKLLN